jgi:hypothetical protein
MVAPVSSPTAPTAPTAEHGDATRYQAAEVPSIKSLRLSPHGAEASLVNISSRGLLAECVVRLKVGSAVTVLFEGGFSPISAAGRVARCEVSAMGRDGVLRYHVGIAFNSPVELKDVVPSQAISAPEPLAPTTPAPASVPAPEPALPQLAAGEVLVALDEPAASSPAVARNRW